MMTYTGMSNFKLALTSRGKNNLMSAVSIIRGSHSTMTHYAITEDVGGAGRLTLYWTDCKDTNILPYPLDTDEKITDFVWNWLSSAKRGIEPDIDGHCTEDGFSLRTFEQDGYRWQMALTIAAEWSVHHK
jgi:hypothetical protein